MNPQSIACLRWRDHINTDMFDHDGAYFLRGSARHPIAPRCGALAALRLLAGMCPPRRCALPSHRITAHSGAFN